MPSSLEKARSSQGVCGSNSNSSKENQQYSNINNDDIVNKSIRKKFNGRYFNGIIKFYDPEIDCYRVVYEDGDEEDMTFGEAVKQMKLHDENIPKINTTTTTKKEKTPTKKTKKENNYNSNITKFLVPRQQIVTASSRYGRIRAQVNYAESSEIVLPETSEEEEEEVVHQEKQPDKSTSTNKNNTTKKRKIASGARQNNVRKRQKASTMISTTESSSEFSDASGNDISSMDDDGDDSSLEGDDATPPKRKQQQTRKRASSGTAKKSATTKAKNATKTPPTSKSNKVSMAEAFQPMNNPLFQRLSRKEIASQKLFLDPCGQEATDDIIGSLMGQQVDKVKFLLAKVLSSCTDAPIGTLTNPLTLGTACSGTDAPALALAMIQEQYQLRCCGSIKDNDNLFHYKHVFSCENDPFKQAYLARNFDSILYPDITKLVTNDPNVPPVDVYGQSQVLPKANVFVAGTSCKNFSMLMSKFRIDIEDKGCSGETFLAACEVLFQEKPQYAILENVTSAPWEKMAEYITGRIVLKNCDNSKAIKEIKKGSKQDLEFTYDPKNNQIVVHQVPAVYGVRCKSAIQGFLTPSTSKKDIIKPVVWPKSKKNDAICTLKELMQENKINKQTDTLVFHMPVTYCTHCVKVDSKDYGVPQTRQRTYMFVWQPSTDNNGIAKSDDDLGLYWEALVKHLKAPVRHSLEAFILQVDHDIIRVFREALRGPPGRQSKRAAFQIPDFWTSASKNLEHNKTARERSGIQDMARPITKWGPFGKKHLPPHYWLEYLNCQEHRQLDMIDILHVSAARDAESHDSNFSSFFWNISQNASKEKHRTATSGIAGCITPGGDVFLPHLGRPLLGCEKLLLQGIPYFSLALGNESEVQLSDLAGNAMTLTTVGATLLAAITCKQLRKETMESKHKDMNQILKQQITPSSKEMVSIPKHENVIAESGGQTSIRDLFFALSKISSEAVASSIWCTCETSGQNSCSKVFLACLCCRISSCRECCGSVAGYQLDGHDVHEVVLEKRIDVGSFENKLRNIVPPLLFFNKEGLEYVATVTNKDRHRVRGLVGAMLSLHKIRRQRRKWVITYYIRDNINQAVAEFRVTVGEISTAGAVATASANSFPSNKLGVLGEFTSFLPAKTEPLVYGQLDPCIHKQVLLKQDGLSIDETEWMAKLSDSLSFSLKVEGFDPTPSFRVEMGLTDDAEKALKAHAQKSNNKISFEKACQYGEKRRFIYPENWKDWPATIRISTITNQSECSQEQLPSCDVSGTYQRASCRHTVAQAGLWIRKECVPTLYLLVKPDISRNGPDIAVISTSLNHEETTCIIAYFPLDWQPCDALKTNLHLVKGVKFTKWSSVSAVECFAPRSKIEVSAPSVKAKSKELLTVSGFSDSDIETLCRSSTICERGYNKLNFTGSQSAQQCIRIFNSLCVAPILKYAAVHGLMYDLKPDAPWLSLEQENGVCFGCCTNTIPCRPEEHWYYDNERESWERRSEPGASRRYYLALQKAPQTFDFLVNKKQKLLQINVLPEVACHHAAYNLIAGRGESLEHQVTVHFRLSCLLSQADPMLDSFKVYSCDGIVPTDVELKSPHKLYLRQQKALTKMLAIEDGNTKFEEIEMSEHEMPGATGWSVTSKATRITPICGGVIADAIGAGKTVVSIAIILRGLEAARSGRSYPRKSSATLVVVPPGLIDQWKSEVYKFSNTLKVICIYDFDSLAKTSMKSIVEADVVLCPVDILESPGYLENLIRKSGRPDEGTPKLPRYVGQTEISGAKGVWIPHTSNDPYGGGNNPNNQKRRNESARYTFVYLNAIKSLRSLTFDEGSKSIPLEYFEWERVIVDEIHECLCTSKDDIKLAKEATNEEDRGFFQEKNRRAGRELLGVMTKDTKMRPLVFRRAIFGLTGTPLLDSPNRVIELANLMGNTYVIGLSSHWRKLERESSRDIFLHNYLEPKTSREIRRNIYEKCQEYLKIAACRNKSGEEMVGIELCEHRRIVSMSTKDGEAYLRSQNGIPPEKQSYTIRPEDFDATSGHDISVFLRQNANLECRSKALHDLCKEILNDDPTTKIVVFCDGRIAAGLAATQALKSIGCTYLARDDTVQQKNKKIAWYQHADVTEEDKKRPRVLVLNFEHAAGLNLQTECYNLILFTPLYVGVGGSTDDPVWDASTELQAIGRVYRPGQPRKQVNVYRIEVKSPEGADCLDTLLIRRNTDKETVEMAVNTSD